MNRQEAEVILKVNDQQAREKFEKLEAKTKELRQQFAEAYSKGDTKAIDAINKKLQQTTKEMNNMRTNAANIRAALVSLDKATPRELQRTIKLINNELNSGRVQRGSKEWDEYVEMLKKVKAELRDVQAEMSALSDEEDSTLDKLAMFGIKWWSIVDLTSRGIDLLQSKFSDWRTSFEEKGESQANLKALTGLDDSSIDWLTKQAEQLSTTMDESKLRITQSSKEILDAYMLVGSNKPELLGDKEALNDVTVEAMRLATAAKMELQPAVDAMTTALNQYGEGADKASRYVNVLAAGSKVGAANVVQQSASILKAGTAAASANVPIEQLVGSIEMLGEKGIKGEVAGTGLKKFFLTLQTGTADTNPKVVGLSTALDNLKAKVDAAEKKSVGGGASFLKKMFGEEAYSIASILTDNTAKVKEYTEAVTGTQTAMEQAAINSDTTAAKMVQMRNTANEAGMAFVEALNPAIEVFAETTTGLLTLLPSFVKLITSCAGTIGTLTVAIVAYNLYMQKSILLDKLKVFWQGKVNASLNKVYATVKAHPYTFVALAVAALVGVLIDLYRANNKVSESQKALNDIKKKASSSASEEITKINLLVSAAKAEKLTLDERKKAIDKLNSIIPDYNAALDETSGKYRENKEALDKYNESLVRKYEIEGAKSKLAELGNKKSDIVPEIKKIEKQITEEESMPDRKFQSMYEGSVGIHQNANNNKDIRLRVLKNALEKKEKQRQEIIDQENAILEIYGSDMMKSEINADNEDNNNGGGGGDTSNATPMDKLKLDLEELKKQYHTAQALNLEMYVTGQKDYTAYCASKEQLDKEYYDNQVETHKKHNKIDIAGYTQLLAQRAKEMQDAEKRERDLTIKGLEEQHAAKEQSIIEDFYDTSSTLYQNRTKLNQRLFEEEVDFLKKKRDLHTEDSEEYAALQKQIEERVAKDQLDKKKETAEALAAFEQEYRKGSGSRREKMELEIIENLHKEGLISEEEYQEAVRKIKDKYQKEDINKARTVQSEYADMILNLQQSFSKLFSELGEEGTDFWANLSAAGEAAFAVMSTMLSQYSAYANAERDAEVAKIERRYDKEIVAAGKNEKKKKKLEEQKEAEIAKVKKKYNDRAMKIELAQAFAATALAAINAYASASKVNFILGPIAAALATAAGMMQIATIKKQHEAEAAGYYSGGFTDRDPNNRKVVGEVHANEFVANHEAVANPAIIPVLRLIDHAQRNNTVGSLTSADVSRAIGQSPGVGAGGVAAAAASTEAVAGAVALVADTNASTRSALDRLSDNLEAGIEAHVIMDGERGFYKKLKNYERLTRNPKR